MCRKGSRNRTATLASTGSLEVVVDKICSEHLQVSEQCIFVGRVEFPQEITTVRAKLQIGLLNQVIDRLGRRLTPLPSDAEDHSGYQGVEPTNEFCPCFR